MAHHTITVALAEAHIAELHRAAAQTGSSASLRRSGRLRTVALGFGAIVALAPAGALAQPAHEIAAAAASDRAKPVHRDRPRSAPRPSITFTNPLGRSRGAGAGGGLL